MGEEHQTRISNCWNKVKFTALVTFEIFTSITIKINFFQKSKTNEHLIIKMNYQNETHPQETLKTTPIAWLVYFKNESLCVSKNLFENAFKTRIKRFKRVASCKCRARVECLEVYINKILF